MKMLNKIGRKKKKVGLQCEVVVRKGHHNLDCTHTQPKKKTWRENKQDLINHKDRSKKDKRGGVKRKIKKKNMTTIKKKAHSKVR